MNLSFLKVFLSIILLAGSSLVPLSSAVAEQEQHPNIVFIMADDLGSAEKL